MRRVPAAPSPSAGWPGPAIRPPHPQADATQELDDGRREALLREATRLAIRDYAIAPTHLQRNVWAMGKGFSHTPRTDERTRPQDVRPVAR